MYCSSSASFSSCASVLRPPTRSKETNDPSPEVCGDLATFTWVGHTQSRLCVQSMRQRLWLVNELFLTKQRERKTERLKERTKASWKGWQKEGKENRSNRGRIHIFRVSVGSGPVRPAAGHSRSNNTLHKRSPLLSLSGPLHFKKTSIIQTHKYYTASETTNHQCSALSNGFGSDLITAYFYLSISSHTKMYTHCVRTLSFPSDMHTPHAQLHIKTSDIMISQRELGWTQHCYKDSSEGLSQQSQTSLKRGSEPYCFHLRADKDTDSATIHRYVHSRAQTHTHTIRH